VQVTHARLYTALLESELPLIASVLNASPTGVLPQTLCTSFEEQSAFLELQSLYHDATVQRSRLSTYPRHTFKLARRLNATDLATLLAFYEAHQGGLIPFYFYNPFDATPPGSNFDATGASTAGRYTVVFHGDWQQSTGLARTDVPGLELVEVA